MRPATLAACLLLAAPWARAQVCGKDYYGPCLLPDQPPAKARTLKSQALDASAVLPGGAFATGAMDVFSLASQDPLTRAGNRRAVQDAVRPEGRGRAAVASEGGLRDAPKRAPLRYTAAEGRTAGLTAAADPADEDSSPPAWGGSGTVLPGGPWDAAGVQDRGASVYVPASTASRRPLRALKSPNLFTGLSRMSDTARRAGRSSDSEQAYEDVQALWDRTAGAQGRAPSRAMRPEESTRFFGLGN